VCQGKGEPMDTLAIKSGWEIVEEEWPDFKGRIIADRPRSVVELLENTVSRFPDRVGFICGDGRLTYGQFDETVNRIAAGLEGEGVGRGDHVAVLLGSQIEFPLTFFALMKLGALMVPLNTRFKGEELAYEINDSESKVLIVDEEYWSFIDAARGRLKGIGRIFFNGAATPEGTMPFSQLTEHASSPFKQAVLSESDGAAIMYTSGTTGKPKGAVLHQRGLVVTAMLVSDFIQYRPGDKMICSIPLFHITGLSSVMLPPIFSAVACVYMKQFKTREFLEIMDREKVTHYMGVVNVVWLMINHGDFDKYDFSSFRTALFGGSFATEEMVRGIFAKLPGLQISVGYGLTESFAIVTSTPFEDALRKINAVGKPLPTVEVRIVDDDGKELPREAIGEIVLKGPKVFKGYWKNPDATKAAVVDGWLLTGDLGKIDDEGFVYILDRKKDMINRGGEKIYSLEVENVISGHPKILDVAVVGVPDKIMGEVVKACVVLRPGENAAEEEIRQCCASCLADYKVPKFVEFMDALPRNPAGKVNKAELRYAAGEKVKATGVTMARKGGVFMEKKVALVTGSARGIGRAIALDLAKGGIRVVINYRAGREAAETLARDIEDGGGEALVIGCDVADDGAVKAMVEEVADNWGSIDILVNNAAQHRGGRIQTISPEDWRLVMETALGGAFHCCRHIIPSMVDKRWGRVINLSSYDALHGYPGDTAYGTAKAGLLGLTMSLAKEVASKGITVNAIVPGFIPTDMTRGLFNTEEKIERELKNIPMRRPGTPEDVAEMVSFLVFKGEYVTGTILRVDGGLAM